MENYIKIMQKMGFLKKFIDIYFVRMNNLGISNEKAFLIIKAEYKENTKNNTYTNVFDVIEKTKNN